MFGKKENIVGLDIGSHSIKMVQVSAKNGSLKLLNLGVASVPREAFAEGRVSKADQVAKCIQQLAGHLKIKDKLVATSISGYEVMIKKIELPMMTEAELENRMQVELGQYIPYNIEEVDVDYQIMDLVKERPNYMDVLLVAAKKESVNDYVSLIRMAGLDPVVVDVDFFALSNAYEAVYGLQEENLVLLDIGANKSIMNITSKGIPIFTRGISIGGNQITQRVLDQFKVAAEEAERLKLGDASGKGSVRDLEDIYVSVVQNWVNEFQRAIDFYYSNFPELKISRIFLSGGSSRIPGLNQLFRESLEVPVELFNPLSHLEYDSKVFDSAYLDYVGPQMAISLGLALRKAKLK